MQGVFLLSQAGTAGSRKGSIFGDHTSNGLQILDANINKAICYNSIGGVNGGVCHKNGVRPIGVKDENIYGK